MKYQEMIKYLKAMLLAGLVTGAVGLAHAQQPDWEADPSRFTNSMVVLGALNFDRTESTDANDKIAAFIDGECRGVVQPMLIEKAGRYIAYLMIYSNENSGTVTFKMYNATENKVVDVLKAINFEVDGLTGDVDRPFVWSNVQLNTETKIHSFSFREQVKEPVIEGNEIWAELNPDSDLLQLMPEFSLSAGAAALVGRTKQLSGQSVQDFTESIVYTIRSEDEQEFEDYTVHVYVKEKELPVTNFISPNGDGINDRWEVQNLHLYRGFRLKVFDKNGSLVYSSGNYQNEWEGQNSKGNILPNGTYFYQFKDASSEYKGTVQIYR